MYYRLYKLSRPSGRFVGFEEFEASDDTAALRICERFVGDSPMELWSGARKVREFVALSGKPGTPRAPE